MKHYFKNFTLVYFKPAEEYAAPINTSPQHVVAMPVAGTATMVPQPPSYQESVGNTGHVLNIGTTQNQGSSVVTPPV